MTTVGWGKEFGKESSKIPMVLGPLGSIPGQGTAETKQAA
jgi:hypothetical protein